MQLSAFYEGFYAHKNITFVKQAAVTGLDLADGKVGSEGVPFYPRG